MSGHVNGEDKDPSPHAEVHQAIKRNADKLESMETILRSGFETVAEELRETRETLVDAVAGKKQVPLLAHLATVGCLFIFCLILLVKIAEVTVTASTKGFHARPMEDHAQRPDN